VTVSISSLNDFLLQIARLMLSADHLDIQMPPISQLDQLLDPSRVVIHSVKLNAAAMKPASMNAFIQMKETAEKMKLQESSA
jgi:hypothetical protein